MMIAALDAGMRQGEMLALQFGDVDWKRQSIVPRRDDEEPPNARRSDLDGASEGGFGVATTRCGR